MAFRSAARAAPERDDQPIWIRQHDRTPLLRTVLSRCLPYPDNHVISVGTQTNRLCSSTTSTKDPKFALAHFVGPWGGGFGKSPPLWNRLLIA